IVSIAADFLSTWLTGNVYAADYAKGRRPEGAWMSKHFQFESAMSVTGTNADARYMISPSQEGKVAAAILDRINGGNAGVEGVEEGALAKAVAALKANRGNALVVAGSNDVNVQMIVNAINMSLDSYGNTIDIKNPLRAFAGDDRAFAKLVSDMKSGAVDAVIFYGTNPVYSYHNAADLRDAMSKVATKVSFNLVADETASLCDYCCPDNHYLESWNDLSIVNGRVDLVQPAITPLFSTRQAQTSLLKWSGNDSDYYTYLRQTHNAGYNADMMNTDQSWNAAVHNGCMMTAAVADAPIEMVAEESAPSLDVAGAIAAVTAIKGGTFELSTYLNAGIGNGSQASNPWLQELPDPVTKVTWDNYVTMNPAEMTK
ncbi:MAG: quinol:cytochrome C oxidoreductase, partial [Flavobacteriales bacterium]|nr:quinol:cytochrome C oxidoreductase [Flavobacteriales bacterium]